MTRKHNGELTRQRFLDAGMALYPGFGYRQLSIRLLSREAGVVAGMFHHLFPCKDSFVTEMLTQLYEQTFTELELQLSPEQSIRTNLSRALRFLARFCRERQPLLRRLFSDCGEGVECIIDFMQNNSLDHVELLLDLLREARAEELLEEAPLAQQASFLLNAVFSPLLLGPRLKAIGLLPDEVAANYEEEVASDHAIDQRLEWALNTLFREKRFTPAAHEAHFSPDRSGDGGQPIGAYQQKQTDH